MGGVPRDHALSRARRGNPRTFGREERHIEYPHGFRQVDGRAGVTLRQHRAWAQERLHLPHQGARERKMDGALQGIRRRKRWAFDRRCDREPRCAHPVLHSRNSCQHGTQRGRKTRHHGRSDGRVPLLLRQGTRRRLAGTAPHAPAIEIFADERDRRRNRFL